MPAAINIETHLLEPGPVYAVSGEMDLAPVPELEQHLDFEGPGAIVVLDLSAVSFIDSTGLRSIVWAHDEAADGGKELRVVAGPKVLRLLQITGLDQRLTVFEDRSSALADA